MEHMLYWYFNVCLPVLFLLRWSVSNYEAELYVNNPSAKSSARIDPCKCYEVYELDHHTATYHYDHSLLFYYLPMLKTGTICLILSAIVNKNSNKSTIFFFIFLTHQCYCLTLITLSPDLHLKHSLNTFFLASSGFISGTESPELNVFSFFPTISLLFFFFSPLYFIHSLHIFHWEPLSC